MKSIAMPDGPFIVSREGDDYFFYPKNPDWNSPQAHFVVSGLARDKIQTFGKSNGVNITTVDILTAIQERGTFFDKWNYTDLAEALVEKLKPKLSDTERHARDLIFLSNEARAALTYIKDLQADMAKTASAFALKMVQIEEAIKRLNTTDTPK